MVPFFKKITPLAFSNNLPPCPIPTHKMAAQSSGVVWAAAAGWHQWRFQGVRGGASVDIGGGGGGGGSGGGGGRGGAAVLALLGLRQGWAAGGNGHVYQHVFALR